MRFAWPRRLRTSEVDGEAAVLLGLVEEGLEGADVPVVSEYVRSETGEGSVIVNCFDGDSRVFAFHFFQRGVDVNYEEMASERISLTAPFP